MPADSRKTVGKLDCFKQYPATHLGVSNKKGIWKNIAHPTNDSKRIGQIT